MTLEQCRRFKHLSRAGVPARQPTSSADARFSIDYISERERHQARVAIVTLGLIFMVICVAYVAISMADRLT